MMDFGNVVSKISGYDNFYLRYCIGFALILATYTCLELNSKGLQIVVAT